MISAVLCSIALLGQVQAPPESEKEVLDRVAVPISISAPDGNVEDFAPLKEKLADVKLVGAGESAPGSREISRVKQRLFQFLVKELDFKVLILEASMVDCAAIDKFVVTGEGNPVPLVKELERGDWTTDEILDLIKWMSLENGKRSEEQKLRVVGADLPNYWLPLEYIESALAKIGVENEYKLTINARKRTPMSPDEETQIVLNGITKYKTRLVEKLGETEYKFLLAMVQLRHQNLERDIRNNLLESLVSYSNQLEWKLDYASKTYEALLKDLPNLAEPGQYAMKVFKRIIDRGFPVPSVDYKKLTLGLKELESKKKEELGGYYGSVVDVVKVVTLSHEVEQCASDPMIRERFLAENVSWAITKLHPGSKAMFWTDNSHVRRDKFKPESEWELVGGAKLPLTGFHLGSRFGRFYYSLAVVFGGGEYRGHPHFMSPDSRLGQRTRKVSAKDVGTFENLLASSSVENYVLDLKPEDLKPIFSKTRSYFTLKNYYAGYHFMESGSETKLPFVPRNSFEGVIFMRTSTALTSKR